VDKAIVRPDANRRGRSDRCHAVELPDRPDPGDRARDDLRPHIYPTTVKKAGVIVAFTVGLSKLETDRAKAKSDIHFLDSTFGGTAKAAITVLRSTGAKAKRQRTVTAESPVFHLQPYLGQVVQFPLMMPLAVKRGDVVALTVPTWAPVLTFNLSPARFAHRQSRSANCPQPAATEQAQLMLSSVAAYGCNYPGTRVEYSETEITNPVRTKNYVHAATSPVDERRRASAGRGGSAAGRRVHRARAPRDDRHPRPGRPCKVARAGRHRPQIGLVARPAPPTQQGRGPRALLCAARRAEPAGWSAEAEPSSRSTGRSRVSL
jgi:hypothetical protein